MIVFSKKLLLLCTLLALIFSASMCSADIKIPRNDGTSLPLNQIADIIRHVTGNLSSTDVFFPKNSLMMIRAAKNAGNISITPSIFTFYRDGDAYGSFDMKSGSALTESMNGLNWNYVPDLHASALTTTTIDGKKSVIAGFPTSANNHSLYEISTARTDTPEDTTYDFEFTSTKNSITQQGQRQLLGVRDAGIPFDSKSGMTVNGFGGELCAEVFCSNVADGLVTLRFLSVEREVNSGLKTTQLDSLTWSRAYPPIKVGSQTNYYIPASIAIGDLNGDGYKNEVALITSDVDNVYLSVFQITYSNGTFSRTALKDNETLYTYQSTEAKRKAVRNGLWGGIPSVCVVTADFDLDGTDELAALFLDDVKEFYKGKEYSDFPIDWGYYYHNDENNEDIQLNFYHYIPDENAIITCLRLASYKWNGSSFSTSGAIGIRTYDRDDIYGSNSPWSYANTSVADVKAVAADWDGDGKKSLVVLRTIFGASDYYIGYELNGYDMTDGKFVRAEEQGEYYPVQFSIASPIDSFGVHIVNPDSDEPYRQVKYSFDYPVFAHNISMTAGPFTGQVGKVFPMDSLVIEYLHNEAEGSETAGQKRIGLVHNIRVEDTSFKNDYKELLSVSTNDFWKGEFDMFAFAAADFASEGAQIGDPIKIVSPRKRNNYLAILQAPPYHVDTLTLDGTAIQKEPRNFTYRTGATVGYSNSNTVTSKDIVKFNMSKSLETIFAFDSERELLGGIKSITGSVSSVLDNDLIGKIPGVSDIKKKFSSVSGFVNSIFDKIENTTEKVNEHTATTNINISTAASLKDVLYLTESNQYIWRYPVLTKPAPAWLIPDRSSLSADFGSAKIEDEETYITFIVDDTPTTKNIYGQDDDGYQPFREIGNLFSYPPTLSEVQGYANRTALTKEREWGGPEFREQLKMTEVSSDHTVTSTKVKKGMISEFFSMLDSVIGEDNIARESTIFDIPDPKDFTRTVSSTEAIDIKLPTALEGAGHNLAFEGYLDAGGAMTVAFAVKSFNRNDAIWGTRSLYGTKPDPALLLSQKFIYRDNSFAGNENDPTALQIGGVRFSVPYYGKESNNLLVKNLEYAIEVPVYNASFVAANNVKLRLSYAAASSYNGVEHFNTINRTTIAETTLETLPGWESGNRVMAKFTWNPTVNVGKYYLFVEIDPDNTINEVHENRKDSRGNILDFGGNNLGYFAVDVVEANSRVYNRTQIAATGVMTADNDEALDYLYEHTYFKLNGTEEWDEFWALFESYDHEPTVIEAEVIYDGEYVVPSVNFVGGIYTEQSMSDYLQNGKEPTYDDVEIYFINKNITLIPGQSETIYFIMDDIYDLLRSAFELELPGKSTDNFNASQNQSSEQSNTQNQTQTQSVGTGPSSSSGGCNAGFSVLGLALSILIFKRK